MFHRFTGSFPHRLHRPSYWLCFAMHASSKFRFPLRYNRMRGLFALLKATHFWRIQPRIHHAAPIAARLPGPLLRRLFPDSDLRCTPIECATVRCRFCGHISGKSCHTFHRLPLSLLILKFRTGVRMFAVLTFLRNASPLFFNFSNSSLRCRFVRMLVPLDGSRGTPIFEKIKLYLLHPHFYLLRK